MDQAPGVLLRTQAAEPIGSEVLVGHLVAHDVEASDQD